MVQEKNQNTCLWITASSEILFAPAKIINVNNLKLFTSQITTYKHQC